MLHGRSSRLGAVAKGMAIDMARASSRLWNYASRGGGDLYLGRRRRDRRAVDGGNPASRVIDTRDRNESVVTMPQSHPATTCAARPVRPAPITSWSLAPASRLSRSSVRRWSRHRR